VQAARAGERRHSEPGGHPFPELARPTKCLAFPSLRWLVRHRASLIPNCQPNRRVSLLPRTLSSRRAASGFSKHYTRCSPVGCSTQSGVLQQPLRVPLFVNTTPTNPCPDMAEALWRHRPQRGRPDPSRQPVLHRHSRPEGKVTLRRLRQKQAERNFSWNRAVNTGQAPTLELSLRLACSPTPREPFILP
jgi:hypothetical protein